MSEQATGLATSGSTAMTETGSLPAELQVVARSPAEMQQASEELIRWFRGKVGQLKLEAADAAENLRLAKEGGFRKEVFQRQNRIAWRRVEFYEKCLAAVEAGYVIVPNFPVDVFAVRVKRDDPKAEESTSQWERFTQEAESLPAGEGRYVDRFPVVHQETRVVEHKAGESPKLGKVYWPEMFAPEIEYPVSIAEPRVMRATTAALATKIFDQIGCLPERRSKGDPIVLGQVVGKLGRYEPTVMSFLIAWYIDTRTL